LGPIWPPVRKGPALPSKWTIDFRNFEVFLTIPASVVSGERSFSRLKPMKKLCDINNKSG